MRIAVVKSQYTPYGGAEKYTTRLINAFVERGCEVHILTSSPLQWEGLKRNVGAVNLKSFPYTSYMKLVTFNGSVERYLRDHHYDCVFGMDRTSTVTHIRTGGGCHASWIDRRCNEVSRIKCASFRCNPFHRASIAIESHAFQSAGTKKIFCNSKMVEEEILKYYRGARNKLTVVHNGVEWNELQGYFDDGIENKSKLLRSLSLDEERFYFLYIGSGYARKGVSKAILAMKYLSSDVGLLIVGKDKNEARYKRLAVKLGIDKRISFFGPQKNVMPFLQVSDAFVLPTLYDPFSNATLEALAMGLYSVTSDANGCAEVIRSGTGKVIHEISDIGSIVEAMQSALSGNLSREEIRQSVSHLTFENQLGQIVDQTLASLD